MKTDTEQRWTWTRFGTSRCQAFTPDRDRETRLRRSGSRPEWGEVTRTLVCVASKADRDVSYAPRAGLGDERVPADWSADCAVPTALYQLKCEWYMRVGISVCVLLLSTLISLVGSTLFLSLPFFFCPGSSRPLSTHLSDDFNHLLS